MKDKDFYPKHLQVPEDNHHPEEGSWAYVQKEKRDANRREAEEWDRRKRREEREANE